MSGLRSKVMTAYGRQVVASRTSRGSNPRLEAAVTPRSSSKTSASSYTIDYSPESNFLKEMRQEGRVQRVLPAIPCKRPKPSTKKSASPAYRGVPPFKRKCSKKTPLTPTSKLFYPQPCPGIHKFMTCEPASLKNSHICAKKQSAFDRLTELQEFRNNNLSDCKMTPRPSAREPSHICVHEYELNERLLPEPLVQSGAGVSLCGFCHLPSSDVPSSTHYLVTAKGRREIGDPALGKPLLRSTTKNWKITEAPTLSYVPHFRQRLGLPLMAKKSSSNEKCYLIND